MQEPDANQARIRSPEPDTHQVRICGREPPARARRASGQHSRPGAGSNGKIQMPVRPGFETRRQEQRYEPDVHQAGIRGQEPGGTARARRASGQDSRPAARSKAAEEGRRARGRARVKADATRRFATLHDADAHARARLEKAIPDTRGSGKTIAFRTGCLTIFAILALKSIDFSYDF